MAKQKKTARDGYPYKIKPFKGKVEDSTKIPSKRLNEFFLIETLLRSDEAITAYKQGGAPGLMAVYKKYNVFYQDPLKGTHHSLLSRSSSAGKGWPKKLAKRGYVDIQLGILDLGARATLLSEATIGNRSVVFYDTGGGENECLSYLRNSNPRFLCLRLDTAQPPEVIIQRLRPLLRARHNKSKNDPLRNRFTKLDYRASQRVSRDIDTWIRYFQCYDLWKQGETITTIADRIYSDSKDSWQIVNRALLRVKQMINTVESTGWLPRKIQ